MKQVFYNLIAVWVMALGSECGHARDAKVNFTMQNLEPGQSDGAVSFSPNGGKYTGSCAGIVEETWSGITYYTPSSCSGTYQTNWSRVGARPGFRFDSFFLFRSLINNRQMSVMSSGGNCPSGSQNYNYILIRGKNKNDYVGAMDFSLGGTWAGGVLTYDSSAVTGVSRFSLEGLTVVPQETNSFSYQDLNNSGCASGSWSSQTSDWGDAPLGDYVSWLFGSNLAVSISDGSNPVMSVAIPQSTLSTETSFWEGKNKSVYTGLMTIFVERGQQEQKNIYLTPDATGRVFSISEASGSGSLNNTSLRASLGSLECSQLNTPSSGFCSGTLSFAASPSQLGKVACLFSFDTQEKDLIFCAAQRPSDKAQLITFLGGTSSRSKLEVSAAPLHLAEEESSGTVSVTVTNLTSRPVATINPELLNESERLAFPFSALSSSTHFTGNIGAGGFISGSTCGTSLAAYSTCSLQVSYDPSNFQVDKQTLRLPYSKNQNSMVNATTSVVASRGLSSLSIVAADFTVGAATQATVTAHFADGSSQDVTTIVSFQSSNAQVPVSENGVITAPGEQGSSVVTAAFGGVSNNVLVTAYLPPPEPTNLVVSSTSFSQADLSWTSGGGSTAGFQIAYRVGTVAPLNCNSGTVIPWGTQGATLNRAITGLAGRLTYSFRVCAANAAGSLSAGITATVTTEEMPNDFWVANASSTPRTYHTAVWTGSKMIVWGGENQNWYPINSGGIYDPATDSWSATSTTNAPTGRYYHTAVWTGSKMIVWGGYDWNWSLSNTGGVYDPATDSWSATSTTSAPASRYQHTAVWTGSKMIVWGGYGPSWILVNSGAVYDPATDSWSATSTTNAPSARDLHSAVWTGSKMIIWGGGGANTGGVFDPNFNSWLATSTVDAPSGRSYHRAVWTGSKMIVWGGNGNTGGLYNPTTDSWTATATEQAPELREGVSAVWTGSKMIVWGGYDSNWNYTNIGGVYDPEANSWTSTTTLNAPMERAYHTAVWTGSKMIVWGGDDFSGVGGIYSPGGITVPNPTNFNAVATSATQISLDWAIFETGASGFTVAYQDGTLAPTSCSVTAGVTLVEVNDPSQVSLNVPAFSSGGHKSFRVCSKNSQGDTSSGMTAGAYLMSESEPQSFAATAENNQVTLSWAAPIDGAPPSYQIVYQLGSEAPASCASGNLLDVYSGSTEIVSRSFRTSTTYSFRLCKKSLDNVSAGVTATVTTSSMMAANSWMPMSEESVPAARYRHSGIWTGSKMIVWGGFPSTNSGGIYDPTTDSWSPTSATDAPSARYDHSAVWTGSKMIVWGGISSTNTGGVYDPATDSWVATTTTSAPTARYGHTAVWTGSKMIVWGGYAGSAATNSGGIYDPTNDRWMSTSIGTNVAAARYYHTAVWTGREMIVWGGTTGSTLNTGARYNPISNDWATTTTTNAPAARSYHTAVWTGSRMIVWGGSNLNTGGVYNPVANSWTATSTTDVPAARQYHTALWTGSRMIVWGGSNLNTGGVYDPATNSWTATSTTDAPTARQYHTAVWTGSKMIVWGGQSPTTSTGRIYGPGGLSFPEPTQLNVVSVSASESALSWAVFENGVSGYTIAYQSGAVAPATCSATAGVTLVDITDPEVISRNISSLATNSYHSFRLCSKNASEVLSSGITATNYLMSAHEPQNFTSSVQDNQITLNWTAPTDGDPLGYIIVYQEGAEPPANCNSGKVLDLYSGVVTSSTFLKTATTFSFRLCKRSLDTVSSGVTTSATTGPMMASNSWLPITTEGAPSARSGHTAVWTGSKMIIWGGGTNTGGIYDPATDSWTATSTTDAPSSRSKHAAFWTGSKMIIWGGGNNTGGIYDPATDSWTATSTTDAPTGRSEFFSVWTGSRMLVWGGSSTSTVGNSGGIYDPTSDSWLPMSRKNAPEGRYLYTNTDSIKGAWTGSRMVVWGGWNSRWYIGTGGLYDPLTNTWQSTAVSSPWGTWWGVWGPSFVWTGSKVIIWGGVQAGLGVSRTGGVFDPVTNSWVSTTQTGAPAGRWNHTTTWTGSQMVVFGGNTAYNGGSGLNTGGLYDPATDSWTSTSTTGAPDARANHTAVWTGSTVLVWGGNFGLTNTGGIYRPVGTNVTEPTNLLASPSSSTAINLSWNALGEDITSYTVAYKTGVIAPTSCLPADGVTISNTVGTETTKTISALTTANYYSFRVCSRNAADELSHGTTATAALVELENPVDLSASVSGNQVTLTWSAPPNGALGYVVSYQAGETAPSNCNSGIFWNGFSGSTTSAVVSLPESLTYSFRLCSRNMHASSTGVVVTATTGSHSSNTWAEIAELNAPSARAYHSMIWTGSKMIIWGGNWLNTGGVYDPATDSWTATSTTNAPSSRSNHTAVWTGSKMIIWGGGVNTGGIYDPATDSWTATSTTNAPVARTNSTAVWTGSKMIVWGGSGSVTNTGGVYDPETDTWSATSTTSAPAARYGHSAVWTGSTMIVWGGWNDSSRFNNGGIYTLATDSWSAVTTTSAPIARSHHTGIWTGTRMIIWGGVNLTGNSGSQYGEASGGVYNPSTNTWSATSSVNNPVRRFRHTAVWTGTTMLIWGGREDHTSEQFNSGGIYAP